MKVGWIALAAVMGSLLSPVIAAQRGFSDEEKEQIYIAALRYAARASHNLKMRQSFVSQNAQSFTVCVGTPTSKPDPQLQTVLSAESWRLAPDEKGSCKMQVAAGEFSRRPDGTVDVVIGATCGFNCAGSDTYTLRTTRGAWHVVAVKPGPVS